ncbi:fumarate reductase 1 [[Candida] railenensis]|uniref:Fumarate reductase 1 n=1 Tax=[Candida] railenensis TaxID=45579 RepID=A0A9P0QV03_9ASCO|nr:fumarate reductase 1 [[Candida] railenensis]
MSPENPIIIVGGGLAGLSAAHQCYLRGANVILLDKQGFLSGNSGKATSGINGALTRTQIDLNIEDSVKQFYEDTLKTAKDRANPDLIKVLTYNSADAVHWLQEVFALDLSVVSRLGGHSQPRTHRGKDAKFPGMAITYALLEKLENLADSEPHRIQILKKCQVIDLIKQDDFNILGVKYKNLVDKTKHELNGPVIMATGGYAADFTKNSLLRKYRPDIIDLPSTNGNHATGDGQKIIMKNSGVGIDLDKVQVHPTGLINLDDSDVISGKSSPRFLFLGAEALRGEGGIMLNKKGERFCDELGTRDYVSGKMEEQLKQGNGPIRLILNSKAESKLDFHIKHYSQRNLMKKITGDELVKEFGENGKDIVTKTLDSYNKAAADSEISDAYGKQFFPATPFELKANDNYYMSFITRVLHFTMGGIKINDKSEVLYQVSDKNEFKSFEGLYACGEVAGGVHGHNRLGGSSLLACVVYGRVAADSATKHVLEKLSQNSNAINRLKQISVHIEGNDRVVIQLGGEKSSSSNDQSQSTSPPPSSTEPPKKNSNPYQQFEIPAKEFTAEEVAKHNSPTDCWCIVKNVVLDLTSFLKDHPGGESSILNFAGKDATESFDMLHEDNVIVRYAKECVLGRLKGKTPGLQL